MTPCDEQIREADLRAVCLLLMAMVVGAGLLTTSSYPTIYASDVSTLNHSIVRSVTAGNAFRLLSVLSFLASLFTLLNSTVVLCQIALFHNYYNGPIWICLCFFAVTILSCVGATLIAILTFLEIAMGWIALGICVIGILTLVSTVLVCMGTSNRRPGKNRTFHQSV